VYFIDAAHFVLAPFLGFLWSISRIFIKTPAGRSRLNVLGSLNATTQELITVINDTFVNADTVRSLLDKLRVRHPTQPLTVVLDNAKYQRCEHVTTYARQLNIELLFLPSYSPNLNLIERLWKLIKKKCLYSKYYSSFSLFKSAIVQCIADLPTEYADEMRSLMSLKFQTIKV
jgi:transposase